MQIWVVDAFTNQPFKGNPAAVAIVDEFPADDRCLKIAAEMNLSETAFVKPLAENKFHIRWFTPATEVKLCGHATLASAHILCQENKVSGDAIVFESLSGILNVNKIDDNFILDFPLQETGPALEKKHLEDVLGMSVLAAEQALDCIIVELADEKMVREFALSADKIISLDCRGLIITTKGHNGYDFVSRYFAPKVGIYEDPVTGSAHCKLAHYWQKKLNKNKFMVYQASKRGGEMELEVRGSRVLIRGMAITMYSGSWLV